MKKKKYLAANFFSSHTQTKHFYFYQPSHFIKWICVYVVLSTLMTSGDGKQRNYSCTNHKTLHFVHALKWSAPTKPFFVRYIIKKPLYLIWRARGKKWSDENKFFYISFVVVVVVVACFIAWNAWMKWTLQAIPCNTHKYV